MPEQKPNEEAGRRAKASAPSAEQTSSASQQKQRTGQDDDVVGKVYDSVLARRLFGYLRPYTLQAIVSAIAILLKSLCDVAGPFFIKTVVDTYLLPTGHPAWLGRHLPPVPMRGVEQLAGLYLGALLLSFCLEFVQTYLMQWTGQKIMFDLRAQIFRHIQRMHVAFFDRNPVGRLVTRVTSDVDALNDLFTSGVLAIFEDVFTLTWIVIIMLWMSWPLALLTLAVIPGIVYATKLFRDHVRASYRRQRAATAKINAFTQEYVSGMSVVQLFNREQRAFHDFSAVNEENKVAWTDAIFAYALYYPVVEVLSAIAIALVIWRGGHAVLNGAALHWVSAHHYLGADGLVHASLFATVSIGVLLAFIQYAQRFFRPIMDLSDKFNILQSAMAASERIFKLLDTEPEITSPAHILAPDHASEQFGAIELRDVWFTYQTLSEAQRETLKTHTPSDDAMPEELLSVEWILRGVSFRIAADETAAIVGHTGAGKTTITALMMRFYDVQSGAVLVDGVDVREQDLNALRRRFGVVLQDPFLFSGTIAQNIRLGTDAITDEDVANAAEEVNVADFIATLPAKYAEPVLERGSTLSTGQKQLISFARALAHRPGILILDEATSSVDTETEFRVRTALERMITGRTSVLIAHRLSTIQRADTILVMHKGHLRETGTHQQLLAQRGLYYKLYQLQYKDQELVMAETSAA
jgi:ATP-binding cassette subfamily B multidrug efflux pump